LKAVVIRIQDGTETDFNLDRLRVFKSRPQVEWRKELLLAEKERQDTSNALFSSEISEIDSSFQQDFEIGEPEFDSRVSQDIVVSQHSP